MRTLSGVTATAMALKPIQMQLVALSHLPKVCFRTTTGRHLSAKFKDERPSSRQVRSTERIQAFSWCRQQLTLYFAGIAIMFGNKR